MLKKIKFIDFIYYFFIFILFGISFYFSREYSIYNTDFIHWGYIFEQVFSYLNGNKLYEDIFLQYGEGQIVLLSIIDNFYKIDLYSLGIISSLIFSLKFFLIFEICANIIRSRILSLICTLIVFFSITYSQIPWPDLYSGFFLLIFFYFLIKNNDDQNLYLTIFTSFIFFLTIYFRNTYLLNFILSAFFYFAYETFFIKKRNLYIYKVFLFTTFFLIVYLIILFLNENLRLWYVQGLGLSDQYFGVNELELIDRFKNYFYYIARLIYHVVIPKNLPNLFFSFCILFNVIYLFFGNFFLKNNKTIDNSLIKFLCIYGLCGLVQLLSDYEIFRYINSSISLYIIFFYFIERIEIFSIRKKMLLISFLAIIYSVNLIKFFPMSSHNHKIVNFPIETYSVTNFKSFGKKKISKTYSDYFHDISLIICNKNHIYNLTWDKTYNFLCNDVKTIHKYSIILRDPELLSRLQEGENINSRIILSSTKLDDLEQIKEFKLPRFFRYTESDTYMRFYPDTVYVYK